MKCELYKEVAPPLNKGPLASDYISVQRNISNDKDLNASKDASEDDGVQAKERSDGGSLKLLMGTELFVR